MSAAASGERYCQQGPEWRSRKGMVSIAINLVTHSGQTWGGERFHHEGDVLSGNDQTVRR